MYYDILVEPSDNNQYLAKILAWSDFVVHAPTRQEAVQLARLQIAERLKKAELVRIEVDVSAESASQWLPFSGMYADNPLFAEVEAEVMQARDQSAESSP